MHLKLLKHYDKLGVCVIVTTWNRISFTSHSDLAVVVVAAAVAAVVSLLVNSYYCL
jgi:hypothetical protein